MNTIITLLYFILILGIIIVVHEFGHFFFARLFNVHIYEFSLGMGPKIWGTKPKKGRRKKGKKPFVPFNIRAIPIGGYVSLAGEEAGDDDKSVPADGKLFNKPIWQRFLIMFFGAGNNFILAFIFLILIGLFGGAQNMDPVVRNLDEKYPMYTEGIRVGDVITKIDNHGISTIDDVQVYMTIAKLKGKTITIETERDGKKTSYNIVPTEEKDKDNNKVYKYGIVFENEYEHGLLASLKFSVRKIGALCKQMVIVLTSLFTGKLGLASLSGPVGIYSVVGEARSTGIINVLYLIALLSVNIGFINLIPLPAFDGGRILFLIIEKIKGSPVDPKIENTIHNVGFIILMGLMLVVTFNDIFHVFN